MAALEANNQEFKETMNSSRARICLVRLFEPRARPREYVHLYVKLFNFK